MRLADTADLFVAAGYSDLRGVLDDDRWQGLIEFWEMRHIYTHNDGLVGARFLSKVPASTARVGQRLTFTEQQCRQAIADTEALCHALAGLTAPERRARALSSLVSRMGTARAVIYVNADDPRTVCMGASEALQVVEEHLNRGIKNVRGSRDRYRRGAQLQTVLLALLSAATTVLIGLNAIDPADLLVAASLVTGGLTTVATAWSAWFGFRQLWSANTVTLARLWELRDQIEYDKAKFDGAMSEEAIGGYHESLRTIFASHNKQWENIRSAQSE